MADTQIDTTDVESLTYGAASIRAGKDNLMALPRKDPLFDRNVALAGVAHGGEIDFFKDTSTFSPAPAAGSATAGGLSSTKTQGRDTNVASKLGMTSMGEKFWIYGASCYVDAAGTKLNLANGIAFHDEVRTMRGLGWLEWTFAAGNQLFFRRPQCDIPYRTGARPIQFSQTAAGNNVLFQIEEPGMLDMRVNLKPYLIEPMEEAIVAFKWTSSAALLTVTIEIVYTFQFEGIRVFGQKM